MSRVAEAKVEAGNLRMAYHAEIPTVQTQSFDSVWL